MALLWLTCAMLTQRVLGPVSTRPQPGTFALSPHSSTLIDDTCRPLTSPCPPATTQTPLYRSQVRLAPHLGYAVSHCQVQLGVSEGWGEQAGERE